MSFLAFHLYNVPSNSGFLVDGTFKIMGHK